MPSSSEIMEILEQRLETIHIDKDKDQNEKPQEKNGEKIESNKTEISQQLYSAKEHDTKFKPLDYLEGFYKTHKEDGAMQMILFFLPGILYRLPEKIENLLDLGAGPTVYIPIAVRHRVFNIFTSDYAQCNRETLTAWIRNESPFDWTNVCKWIESIESSRETPEMMQGLARSRMRAVLNVNVFKDPVVQNIHFKKEGIEIPNQFDVVSTVFCLEYASETYEEYQKAVKGACSLIKPGGFLVQGGVLEANEYSFGDSRFKCHRLEREQLMWCLEDNGMNVDPSTNGFRIIIGEDIFILISQKLL